MSLIVVTLDNFHIVIYMRLMNKSCRDIFKIREICDKKVPPKFLKLAIGKVSFYEKFSPQKFYRRKILLSVMHTYSSSFQLWIFFFVRISIFSLMGLHFLLLVSWYTLFYKSDTFKSNTSLKMAFILNHKSRKILRTKLHELCQIALVLNIMFKTFLSGRVRPIFG